MSFSVFQIRVNETGYANPRANHVPLIINAQNISSRGLEIFGFNRNATVLLGKLLHIPKLRVWWKKFRGSSYKIYIIVPFIKKILFYETACLISS